MSQQGDVTLCEKNADNRLIIEVLGKDIVTSTVLDSIEKSLLDNPLIEEVRFVAGNLLSVDSNLERHVWRGRNVVVYAHKIAFVKPVCWILSGKDSNYTHEENAGTDSDGNGLNGGDGYPGESGGNVSISAKAIDNLELLTIESNGGNGSKGQDGGNGRAGEDGVGISKEDFLKDFPPTASFLGPQSGADIRKTCRKLSSLADDIKTDYSEGWFSGCALSLREVEDAQYDMNFFNFYFHIVTNRGNEIIFSHQQDTLTTMRQSYLLYRGSLGKPGKAGGESGLGGQGGFPGEVTVDCAAGTVPFSTSTNKGKDGENGQGGLYGQYGKDGWDMAYMDYLGFFNTNWPKYFGTDANSKLTLQHYHENSSDRVYCCYYSRKEQDMYAQITASSIEHKKIYQERNNNRTRNARQHNARATGKNTISKRRIQNTYSEYVETTQQNIRQEQEMQQRAEMERVAREAAERHRLAREAAERQRLAQEAAERERLAREAAERHRLAREAAERHRIAQEAAERERLAREAAEREHLAREAAERHRLAREAAERLRIAQEAAERERLAREAAERQRLAKEAAERERLAQEAAERERLAQEAAERERLAREAAERQRLAREAAEMERGTREAFEARSITRSIKSHEETTNRTTNLQITMSDFSNDAVDLSEEENKGTIEKIHWRIFRATDRKGVRRLLEEFNSIKTCFSNANCSQNEEDMKQIQQIDQMLVTKYKLTALSEIESHFPPSTKLISNIDSTSRKIEKYLVETEHKDDISHKTLGTLKQYIFDNTATARKQLGEYFENQIQKDNSLLHRARKMFIEEVEYFEYTNPTPETTDCLKQLNQELQKPQHKETLNFWNNYKDDKSMESDMKKMMKKDTTLSKLYGCWYESRKQDNEKICEKFKLYLTNKGVRSKCCRELLAREYDVNIRVYGENEDKAFIIVHDHNSSALKTTHILLRNNEFVQLRIDEDYLKLAAARRHFDCHYKFVLNKMDTLHQIEEIDRYLLDIKLPADCGGEDKSKSSFDEEVAVQTIGDYFAVDEREQIKAMLSKLSFECTNQFGILEKILRRFSCEGKHVSSNEILYFILYVLSHSIYDEEENHTFAWIVASFDQSCWIDEIILLQLENYFKRQVEEKKIWREYMSKIDNKEVLLVFAAQIGRSNCSVERIGTILRLLSSMPLESINLEQIHLSEWHYVLKEYYWTFMLKPLAEWGTDDGDLLTASYYMVSIDNKYGTALPERLLKEIKSKREEVKSNTLLKVLSNLHSLKWLLTSGGLTDLEQSSWLEWTEKMQEMYKPCLEEQTITQLTTHVRNNLDKSSRILEKLPNIEKSLENISGKQNIVNDKPIANFMQDDIKKWALNFKKSKGNHSFEEMLTVVDRAIELNRGFALRNTQRLAVLALLTNGQSTLAQVSTGEGKSLIVVTVSIIKALSGKKVDIITSSPVLAKRDAEVNKDIYNMFDVKVSHNCSEDEEKRKDAYSCHQIVYGDLASFQRDYLLDRFYGKRILGARDFAVAIVDEVDSMLLDKGNNMLYLSHDIPGMDKLESLYVFIWQMVNSPSDDSDEELVQEIKKAVLSNLYKTVTLDDIKSLDSSMTDKQARDISSCLVTNGLLDDDGRILTKTVDESVKKLNQSLSTDLVSYKDRLCFLLTECIRHEKPFNIPNFLKKFVERHLTAWITSAINALFMIPGESYVLGIDKSESSTDRNANIIILDSDTGTDQASSQWDEALHQFLQLKHGCKLSMQSLKAVFISNVSYFKEYDLLYGLTGTLGSQPERELLQEEHGVDFVTIPTAKSKQFAEYDSIVCSDERAWKRNIRSEVERLLNEQKRSVLIICETINDAESLKKVFEPLKPLNPSNVHLYTRDYQKFDIANGSNQLAQGQIIIATNLAGRGTDIQISDDLKQAGGLHVILSYLPANIRIEEQAFGRAARCGDKGSGRMIVMIPGDEESNRQSKIFEVKKNRDANELCRLSNVKKYYETTIRTEESCFDKFRRVYERNKDRLCDYRVPKAIIDILMQSCLNRWAFWLDENSAIMGEVEDQDARQYVEGLLKSFTAELSNLQDGYGINTYKDEESPWVVNNPYLNSMEWHAWVEENPNQMLKLAKILTEKSVEQHAPNIENIDTACSRLLDNFIEREPYFCESAYYYSACLLLKNPLEYADKMNNYEKLKQNLRKARNLFEKDSAFALQASNIVGSFKGFLGWSDGYKEQKKAEAHIYQQFQHSIDDLLGHAITPESFVNHDIDNDISERIFEDILKAGIITKPKVRKTIYEEQLQNIHQDYGIPITALKKFLSENAGPIEEAQFISASQKYFEFPSREQFWDILVEQKVLYEEQSIVVVDITRLQAADPSLTSCILDMANKQTLIQRTIAPSENQIVLRHEQLIASVNEIGTNNKTETKSSITAEDAEAQKAENNEAKDVTTYEEHLNGEPQYPIVAQEETTANTEESTGENLAEASQRVHMSPNDEKNAETHVQHGQEQHKSVTEELNKRDDRELQNVLRHEQLIASVDKFETNDEKPEETSITAEDAEAQKRENQAKDESKYVEQLIEEPLDGTVVQEETAVNSVESTEENLAEASQRLHMSPNDEKNAETHVQQGQERQDFVAKTKSDCREYIFEKEEFCRVVGKKNFDYMEAKGLISLNKMADIDRSKIASCVFSSFNSINVKDITEKTNICKSEAELIIDELAKHNIIKQEGESYDLQMESISGKQVLLPSYPVYESVVQSLLKACFPYKFTLKNLEHQLNQRPPVSIKNIEGEEQQGKNLFEISLRYQPHQLFFQDLIIQDIICPPKIKTIIDEGKLRQRYAISFTRANWQKRLYKTFSLSTHDSIKLFEDLIRNRWICERTFGSKCKHMAQSIIDVGDNAITCVTGIFDSSNKSINEINFKQDVGNLYGFETVNSKNVKTVYDVNDKTSKCENVHVYRKVEPDCEVSYDLGKNVEKYLKYIRLLSKKETMTHIESVLNNYMSPLKKIKEPSVHLKHIRDSNKETNFGHFEEQYTFILNGLEHFIQLEEKKWTATMLMNVSFTMAFGVAQIIAAAIIEVYSVGAMTHVASGLISEGMNDLTYCVSALKSGYFTWKEYLKQKAISVFFTMATSGIAAYFSRGAKASSVASKISPPGFKENGVELAKLAGGQMNGQFGDRVFFATVKKIVSSTSQGIMNGVISGAVDHLVDTYLQPCVTSLANQALAEMVENIGNHSVLNNLEKVYYALGREKTLSLVRQATSNQFTGEWKEYVSVSKRIGTSVLQGLGSAMQKSGSKSSNMKILGIISKIVNYADHAVHLLALINITNRVFDNIDKEIGKKLQEHSTSTDSSTGVDRSDSQTGKSDYENFKKEVVVEWKSQLSEHVGKVLAQHLVKPLMNDVVSLIKKHVKRLPRLIKEAKLKRDLKKAKKHYDKNKNKAGMTREMKKQLTKQYHDKVLKIMYKTKSPSLYGAVIEEDVPMDLICVGAFVLAAPAILKQMEIDTQLIITVLCEKGGEQTFKSEPSKSGAAHHIQLELNDNHFSFSGTESQSDATGNNCLYAALCQAIPQLRDVGADGFRKNVANSIANNTAIRILIKQGLHRYTIKEFNALGGAKRAVVNLGKMQKETETCGEQPRIFDAVPTHHWLNLNPSYIQSIIEHNKMRTSNFLQVSGLSTAISTITGIAVKDMFIEGGSNYVEGAKSAGKGFVNAHYVRLKLNEEAFKNHPKHFRCLQIAICRVGSVAKIANDYDKFAGVLDNFQLSAIQTLSKINLKDEESAQNVITECFTTLTGLYSDHMNTKGYKYDGHEAEKADFNKVIEILKHQDSFTAYKIIKDTHDDYIKKHG